MFVATFIGSPAMNLYEAGLSADGARSRPTVVLGSQRLDLPAPVAARVAAYQGGGCGRRGRRAGRGGLPGGQRP